MAGGPAAGRVYRRPLPDELNIFVGAFEEHLQ
jgi:hypothetical protein